MVSMATDYIVKYCVVSYLPYGYNSENVVNNLAPFNYD